MLSLFRRRLKTLNRIEILQKNILHNVKVFQNLLPQKHLFPVLKSNAYGHGIAQMISILEDTETPFVVIDSYYEALQVWKRDKKRKVLVIGPNPSENYRYFDTDKTSVVVYDLASFEALGKTKKPFRVHLKINTGLNRQGIQPGELHVYLDALKKYRNLHLEGVCSHFADADGESNDFTALQEKKFSECLDIMEGRKSLPKYIHLANTAGALKTKDPRINGYRLGIGLYGYNPLQTTDELSEKLQDVKPALRLMSTVVNTNYLQEGDKVGYNCIFTAPKAMKIGVLPVGYYEGLPRSLSNIGFVKAKDTNLPIVGRIHMNLVCFDMKNTDLSIGDEVEVIGIEKNAPHSIEYMAKAANTISYEILVNISESIRRVVV